MLLLQHEGKNGPSATWNTRIHLTVHALGIGACFPHFFRNNTVFFFWEKNEKELYELLRTFGKTRIIRTKLRVYRE